MVPAPAASASLGDLIELQVIRHLKHTIQEVWGWDNLGLIDFLGDSDANSEDTLV